MWSSPVANVLPVWEHDYSACEWFDLVHPWKIPSVIHRVTWLKTRINMGNTTSDKLWWQTVEEQYIIGHPNSMLKQVINTIMHTCAPITQKMECICFTAWVNSLRDQGGLSSPTAIAINSEYYVYISKSNLGVSIFNKEGCFVKAFWANLKDVKAMHINSRGNLYACESRNNRVYVFSGIKSV